MSAAWSARLILSGNRALFVGVLAGAACLAGWFFEPAQFFHSWLLAWLWWAGLSLGSLTMLMLPYLTGGAWGVVTRRQGECAAGLLPLLALLFLPLCGGLAWLYPWAQPGYVFPGPHQQRYLTAPWFTVRSFVYLAVWSVLAWQVRARAGELDLSSARRRRWSGAGLVALVICMNFAAIDWVMSLEPGWYSTIFVIILLVSHFLSALAGQTLLLARWGEEAPFAGGLTPQHFHDLGNLLLAFVIFWTYVTFSQFLLIWSGNLPKEISWYLHRRDGGWPLVAMVLALFQFALPFSLLLIRALKRQRQFLAPIVAVILLAGVVHVYWLVVPAFHPAGPLLHWLDLAAFVAIGGVWWGSFARLLGKAPPNLEVPGP